MCSGNFGVDQSPTLLLLSEQRGGGGHGRIVPPPFFLVQIFFFYRAKTKTSSITCQPQRTIFVTNTRSKRLESKRKRRKKKKKRSPENEAACPNIKWFCPNVTCFLPEYVHLKNPGGGGGAKSPQPPASYAYACCENGNTHAAPLYIRVGERHWSAVWTMHTSHS